MKAAACCALAEVNEMKYCHPTLYTKKTYVHTIAYINNVEGRSTFIPSVHSMVYVYMLQIPK